MTFKLNNPSIRVTLLVCVLISAGIRAGAQGDDCLPTQFTERVSTAVVTPGDANNVRSEPSTDGALVGQIPPGQAFSIPDEAAVCADGYLWRYVIGQAIEGWTVEGNTDTYFIEPYTEPEPEIVAALPEDGGDIVVESSGVRFVIPASLTPASEDATGIVEVIAQPEIGSFNFETMGAQPSSLTFSLVTNNERRGGEIQFFPYADAIDYWYDGEWMEMLFRDLPPLEQAMREQRSGLPQMPISGVASLFDGVPAYVPFTDGNSLRYITYFAQDNVPFTADTGFSLLYRGLTADRASFIAAQFPIFVPASAIPPGGNEVRADDRYPDYLSTLEANLAALPTSAFTPDLAAYDALMGSIMITDNEALAAAIP